MTEFMHESAGLLVHCAAGRAPIAKRDHEVGAGDASRNAATHVGRIIVSEQSVVENCASLSEPKVERLDGINAAPVIFSIWRNGADCSLKRQVVGPGP